MHTVLLVGIFVTTLVTAVATGIIAYVVIELIHAINALQDAFDADSLAP